MNTQDYFIDDSGNKIFLTVTVSTPAIASSQAEITFLDGKTTTNAVSTDATGFIAKTAIGKSKALLDTTLVIITKVILDKIPSTDWQHCFDDLEIKYYLEGGIGGQPTVFISQATDKKRSQTGKTIIVKKYFDLFIKSTL